MMGSMALIRQVFHDAKWYAQGSATNKDFKSFIFSLKIKLIDIVNHALHVGP